MFKRFNYLKSEIETIKKFIEDDEAELAELKADYHDYLEWKKMRDANEQAAATMGHFYITADDTALLEKLIQECNKDENLAVLLTTAQGTTLSLRTYPVELNNKIKYASSMFNKSEEK